MSKKMIFKLNREKYNSQPYTIQQASDLNIKEKDLENWMAKSKILFGGENILVISQSVSGQNMADILALDADKRLVVVEIKRDWSDRATVGQLLEYAAKMAESDYETLNKLARNYWKDDNFSLLNKFQVEFDDVDTREEDIPNDLRTYIVAPDSDKNLQRIVKWLQECGVPINFVPFTLYKGSEPEDILLEIETIESLPDRSDDEISSGSERQKDLDWFFNTNETNAPDAYKKMFEQGVIAIYGYESGPANLTGTQEGERVFAYVNQKGILAVGTISDSHVVPGFTIFEEDAEFHLKVNWETIVSDDEGVTNSESLNNHGVGLPVRNVFCRLNSVVADWADEELQSRSKSSPPT